MPSTPVSITEPFLQNLQANILKFHGRKFAHHLFFQFRDNSTEPAKAWIMRFAANEITTAKKQLGDTEAVHEGKITDGGTVFTFSFSSTGYDKLDMPSAKPDDNSFKNGMRGSADKLNDKPATWEDGFQSEIDFLIIVADSDAGKAKAQADRIVAETSGFAVLLHNQRGNVLKTKSGIGIEHFGYADGISQPLYLDKEIDEQQSNKQWHDETDLDLLLTPDPGTDEPESFGSFLVFRKLEQNVKGFKDAEGDNDPPTPGVLPVIKDVDGEDNDELAGAMLVGRFENGTAVVQNSIDTKPNPPVHTNDFDYRDDVPANKCPFHSHIRLMNPRNGDTIAGDVREHRITRRGIPYDEVGRIPEDRITSISDDLLNGNQPAEGVGLLFMCYQSQIENQFETLQAFWANRGQIGDHAIGMQDSLIGQGTNPDKTLPVQWGQPAQTGKFPFHGFVTMKGGEYFFTPSISFLKSLDNGPLKANTF